MPFAGSSTSGSYRGGLPLRRDARASRRVRVMVLVLPIVCREASGDTELEARCGRRPWPFRAPREWPPRRRSRLFVVVRQHSQTPPVPVCRYPCTSPFLSRWPSRPIPDKVCHHGYLLAAPPWRRATGSRASGAMHLVCKPYRMCTRRGEVSIASSVRLCQLCSRSS